MAPSNDCSCEMISKIRTQRRAQRAGRIDKLRAQNTNRPMSSISKNAVNRTIWENSAAAEFR